MLVLPGQVLISITIGGQGRHPQTIGFDDVLAAEVTAASGAPSEPSPSLSVVGRG